MATRRARRALLGLGRELARRAGYDLVQRRFYSPVPDLQGLPADVFDRESALVGLECDDDAHMRFAERELAGYIRELDADPGGYPFVNNYYDAGDAHLTYALLRHLRPRRVVELGSGYSTRLIAMACDRNAGEGAPARYVAFDPYPPKWLAPGLPGLTELRASPVRRSHSRSSRRSARATCCSSTPRTRSSSTVTSTA